MLINYVRDKKGRPFGVVVATGRNLIGWSKCNKSDKWNRELGLKIAANRSSSCVPSDVVDVPKDMVTHYMSMVTRSRKYFDAR